jgi:prepilin-type N-terminal cleavage/methylation domain-containing protein
VPALKNNHHGFTVVELVIVIVVIGVLSYLVASTYTGIQQKSRNDIRQNELKTLQQSIQEFFFKHGYFPNLNDLNNPAWRDKNMNTLNVSNMVDPLSQCNPASQACLGGASGGVKNQFEYYATQSDGVTGCNGKVGGTADQNCAEYKLTATYEGSYNGVHYDVLQNID